MILSFLFATQVRAVMLLETYQDQAIEGWVMSEKLDGVRGFWNGKHLMSRQGYRFQAPDYFTHNFPPFAIDGEIFSQRGQFDLISSITRTYEDIGWKTLKLYVFDVPDAEGDLWQRLQKLRDYLAINPAPHIEIIEQMPIVDNEHLSYFLQQIENKGGEGVVVRNPTALYQRGRSSQILKVKSKQDAECTVTAHHPGQGKYRQMLGALSCQSTQFGFIRIGTGFTDQQRQQPPAIGAIITFQYQGLTSKGKLRFPVFLRVRKDTLQQ